MNRSSCYNPIYYPAIAAEFRFEIPCKVLVACHACALILDVTIPCFYLPNFRSGQSSVELEFVELEYRVCVTDAHNFDVNSYAVIQRQYRTFYVIKSIAIECVRAQQGVFSTNFWRRNAFTEQWKHWAANLRLKAQIGSGYLV